MAKKSIDFGTVGPLGNQVSWRAIVDDDTLAAGRSCPVHYEVTRAAGLPTIPPPGVTVVVVKLPLGGPIAIDPPGPDLAVAAANRLQPGETQSIDFQITNGPGGGTPASYGLAAFIFWSGSGFSPPGLITVGAPF